MYIDDFLVRMHRSQLMVRVECELVHLFIVLLEVGV